MCTDYELRVYIDYSFIKVYNEFLKKYLIDNNF